MGQISGEGKNLALKLNIPREELVEMYRKMLEIRYFEEWIKSLEGYSKRKYPLRFVDPSWGLEEILAVLSGLEWSDFSPFMSSKL